MLEHVAVDGHIARSATYARYARHFADSLTKQQNPYNFPGQFRRLQQCMFTRPVHPDTVHANALQRTIILQFAIRRQSAAINAHKVFQISKLA